MLPIDPKGSPSEGWSAYAILFGQPVLTLASGHSGPDCHNVGIAQFAVAMPLSRNDTVSLPTLRHHIPHVVVMRAEEKVVWPDTGGVVTAVQDKETFGDFST
jgi:hypothetical protein